MDNRTCFLPRRKLQSREGSCYVTAVGRPLKVFLLYAKTVFAQLQVGICLAQMNSTFKGSALLLVCLFSGRAAEGGAASRRQPLPSFLSHAAVVVVIIVVIIVVCMGRTPPPPTGAWMDFAALLPL